jgi:hypothetical protein
MLPRTKGPITGMDVQVLGDEFIVVKLCADRRGCKV